MGTSKDYSAPAWGPLKSNVTRWSREGALTPARAGRLLGDYIRANGGVAALAQGGGTIGRGAAQRVARNLAGFISAVGDRGLPAALRDLGLDSLDGKSLAEIGLYLMDNLGGSSSTIDDVDARNALSRLMEELLEQADTPEDVERVLTETATGDNLEDILSHFYAYYLYEQFCRVFYGQLVSSLGEAQAEGFLGQILDYIVAQVDLRVRLANVLNISWLAEEGRLIAEGILQNTFMVFGG